MSFPICANKFWHPVAENFSDSFNINHPRSPGSKDCQNCSEISRKHRHAGLSLVNTVDAMIDILHEGFEGNDIFRRSNMDCSTRSCIGLCLIFSSGVSWIHKDSYANEPLFTDGLKMNITSLRANSV
ncbi:hypothetical protein WA026_013964 [Henosepilachna vigintioctopunctata]|uniref:Uncharacterized protein n=1 Tax=Henosepilachna vigintioctopunctata TaxID=420089 RepID=A0AAW1U6M6_9CUCU